MPEGDENTSASGSGSGSGSLKERIDNDLNSKDYTQAELENLEKIRAEKKTSPQHVEDIQKLDLQQQALELKAIDIDINLDWVVALQADYDLVIDDRNWLEKQLEAKERALEEKDKQLNADGKINVTNPDDLAELHYKLYHAHLIIEQMIKKYNNLKSELDKTKNKNINRPAYVRVPREQKPVTE